MVCSSDRLLEFCNNILPIVLNKGLKTGKNLLRHCISIVSQDADVFLLLHAFSDAIQSTEYFDTGHGARRRQINISGLADIFSKSVRCHSHLFDFDTATRV